MNVYECWQLSGKDVCFDYPLTTSTGSGWCVTSSFFNLCKKMYLTEFEKKIFICGFCRDLVQWSFVEIFLQYGVTLKNQPFPLYCCKFEGSTPLQQPTFQYAPTIITPWSTHSPLLKKNNTQELLMLKEKQKRFFPPSQAAHIRTYGTYATHWRC